MRGFLARLAAKFSALSREQRAPEAPAPRVVRVPLAQTLDLGAHDALAWLIARARRAAPISRCESLALHYVHRGHRHRRRAA